MGDNRSTSQRYSNLSEVFGPTIRDYEGRMGQTFDMFSNDYNRNAQMLGQYANQAQEGSDPEAFLRQFESWTDPLSRTVHDPTSQLQQALNAQARRASEDAVNAMGSQFSREGALNSSAAMKAIGEGAANPFAQAQLQTQQNQLGLTGDLWNRAMGGLQASNVARGQNLLGLSQLMGNRLSNLGGQLGNLASQGFTVQQPQLEYRPSGYENFMSGLGDVANIAGGAIGAATGMNALGGKNALGGLKDLFGGGGSPSPQRQTGMERFPGDYMF